MKVTSDYMLRIPQLCELQQAFGSYRAALNKTGGNIKLACFFIANPQKAQEAGDVDLDRESPIFKPLERAADAETVGVAWSKIPPPKIKRPIAWLCRETGLSRDRVKQHARPLIERGAA